MELTDLAIMTGYVLGSFLVGYSASWLMYLFRKVGQNL